MKLTLRVREIAEKRGMGMRDLGNQADISPQGLYPIWRGNARAIRFETLRRIAEALNVPSGALFSDWPSDDAASTHHPS